MKTRHVSLFVFALSLLLPNSGTSAPKEAILYVQVRNSKLRRDPEFWAPALADLTYGSVLTGLNGGPSGKMWLKAKFGTVEGFVHISAISRRKIVFDANAITRAGGIDQSSIVLAGKGFNNQVENKFKASQGLDFSPVDEIERLGVDGSEESEFIKNGKLIG